MSREMSIPTSRGERILQWSLTTVVVLFSALAVVNLRNQVAMVPSTIWLLLVALMVWPAIRDDGGLGAFLASRLADLAGRRYVSSTPRGTEPQEIAFGFRFLGHRFIQLAISIDSIESIDLSPGQATSLAGRDMNDSTVWLHFHENDLADRGKWHGTLSGRKPTRTFWAVGPARPKEETEPFGLSFVAFVNAAGARLVKDGERDRFIPETPSNTGINGSARP